jgi:YHS domain-containing protein
MPIDPVCKMEISVADAAASQQYQSETIYFCSLDCQRKFDKNPGSYMDDMFDDERAAS